MDIYHLHIALKGVDFWALFGCIGMLVAQVVLVPRSAFELRDVASRWRRLLGIALAMLTSTGLALPLVRVMDISDSPPANALLMLPTVLQQTHFGQIWTIHLIGLLLLWIGWVLAGRMPGRGPAAVMLAIAAMIAWTYSATSHAADGGDFTVKECGDWLHLLAASLWGGGILASALILLMIGKQTSQLRELIGHLVRRLSSLSAIALALVLITGIYSATTKVSSVDELLHSPYGQMLCLKLMLVAAMAGVGAVNRFILVPRIERWVEKATATDDTPIQRFIAAIRVDVVLVLLVLCVAAALIQGMPPASMAGMAEALLTTQMTEGVE